MALTFIKWGKDGSLLTSKVNSVYSVKVYPLICDKITVTCQMPKHAQQNIIQNLKKHGGKSAALYKLSCIIKDLGMQPPAYLAEVEEEEKITSATIQCQPYNPANGFVRLDWNPSRVQALELKAVINNSWLTHPDFGYDYLLGNGKVTRVDFAVDICSEQVNHLYCYPKMQYAEVIDSWKSAVKSGRTEYIGVKTKTGKRFAIYDRIPAIKWHNQKKFLYPNQHIPLPDNPVMRIEARLFPDIPFVGLTNLENPFSKLTVASIKPQENDDPLWSLFLALTRFEGAQATLGRLPKNKRAQFMQRLKQGQAGWWKPEKVWDQLSTVIKKISGEIQSYQPALFVDDGG